MIFERERRLNNGVHYKTYFAEPDVHFDWQMKHNTLTPSPRVNRAIIIWILVSYTVLLLGAEGWKLTVELIK